MTSRCNLDTPQSRRQAEEQFLTLRNNGLKDRVVVVVSHKSGKCIPSELCQILMAEEAVVYAVDTNPKVIDIVSRECEELFGPRLHTQVLDYSDATSIRNFLQGVMEREGRIDALATDLGLLEFMYHLKPFEEQERSEWEAQYRNVLESVLIWSQSVIPFMKEREFGRIIHMVSDTARIGVPRMSLYGALKAAVSSFTRSLAQELARYKITCNCVSIGVQEIDDLKSSSKDAITKLDKTLKLVPLRRYSEPEELALMIAYLASDLGAYITGQTISVSGGLVMT